MKNCFQLPRERKGEKPAGLPSSRAIGCDKSEFYVLFLLFSLRLSFFFFTPSKVSMNSKDAGGFVLSHAKENRCNAPVQTIRQTKRSLRIYLGFLRF